MIGINVLNSQQRKYLEWYPVMLVCVKHIVKYQYAGFVIYVIFFVMDAIWLSSIVAKPK